MSMIREYCRVLFSCSSENPFYPLLRELFFSSVLERQPNVSSYHLKTHRRGGHRKCFLKIKSKLWPHVHYSDPYATQG